MPAVALVDHSGWLSGWLDTLGVKYTRFATVDAAVGALKAGAGTHTDGTGTHTDGAGTGAAAMPLVLAGLNPGNASLDDLGKIKTFAEGGGKVLWLNPGMLATMVYPEYVKGVLEPRGEIMDMDIPESAVFDGLEPMDLRYFNNNRSESPAVCAGAFAIARGTGLSAPVSFTRVHGYLSGDIGQRATALEKLRGFPILRIEDKGTLFLSQVLLEKAVTDPVAGRLFTNLLKTLAYDLP
jgi:hypothetical protein